LAPVAAGTAATGAAVVVAIVTLFLAERLRRGYVAELATSLRSGSVVLDEAQVSDQTTRLTLSRTMTEMTAARLREEIEKLREDQKRTEAASQDAARAEAFQVGIPVEAKRQDDVSLVLSDLTSGDVPRVDGALDRAD